MLKSTCVGCRDSLSLSQERKKFDFHWISLNFVRDVTSSIGGWIPRWQVYRMNLFLLVSRVIILDRSSCDLTWTLRTTAICIISCESNTVLALIDESDRCDWIVFSLYPRVFYCETVAHFLNQSWCLLSEWSNLWGSCRGQTIV